MNKKFINLSSDEIKRLSCNIEEINALEESNILIEKNVLLEGGLDPLLIPYFIRNYELSDIDFLVIKNSLCSIEDSIPAFLNKEIEQALNKREYPLSKIETGILTPDEIITLLVNGESVHKSIQYAEHSFLMALDRKMSSLSEDNIAIVSGFIASFTDKINYFATLGDSLNDWCRFLTRHQDILEKNLTNNDKFPMDFFISMAGENFVSNKALFGNFFVENEWVAKKGLKLEYERLKRQFENRKTDDKDNVFNVYLSTNVLEVVDEFLSNEAVYEITEGNTLNCTPLDKVSHRLDDIHKLIFKGIQGLKDRGYGGSAFSIRAINEILKFCPQGAEKLIVTDEFIEKLQDISKNNQEKNIAFNSSYTFNEANSLKQKRFDYLLHLIKSKSLKPEFKRVVFYQNLINFDNDYDDINRSTLKKNQALKEILDNSSDFFDIENTFLRVISTRDQGYPNGKTKNLDSLRIPSEINSDERWDNYLLKKMYPLGVDEGYFLYTLGCDIDKLMNNMSKEEYNYLSEIAYINDEYFVENKVIPFSGKKNSIKDSKTFRHDVMGILIRSKDFRERILNEDIVVPKEHIKRFISDLSMDSMLVDNQDILEKKKFLTQYINKNKGKRFTNNLFAQDGNLQKLSGLLMETLNFEDLINEFNENKDIENILYVFQSLYNKSDAITELLKETLKVDSLLNNLVGKIEITLENAIDAGLPPDIIHKFIQNGSLTFACLDSPLISQEVKDVVVKQLSSSGYLNSFTDSLATHLYKPSLALSFLKENAPMYLLDNSMKESYINNKNDKKVEIGVKEIVAAVKQKYLHDKESTNNGTTSNIIAFPVTKSICMSEFDSEPWENYVKDLSDEEKILLFKYGSFISSESIIGKDISIDDPRLNRIFEIQDDNRENLNRLPIKNLMLAMPEIFECDFLERNFNFIFQEFNCDNNQDTKNHLCISKSIFNEKFALNFKNEKVYNQLLLNNCLNSDIDGLLSNYVENEYFMDLVHEKINFNTKNGIERFKLLFTKEIMKEPSLKEYSIFQIECFNKLLNKCTDSILPNNNEQLFNLLDFIDLRHSTNPRSRSLISAVANNSYLQEKVEKIKEKIHLEQTLSSISNNEPIQDLGFEFKM